MLLLLLLLLLLLQLMLMVQQRLMQALLLFFERSQLLLTTQVAASLNVTAVSGIGASFRRRVARDSGFIVSSGVGCFSVCTGVAVH
jgi:hypothetical protein